MSSDPEQDESRLSDRLLSGADWVFARLQALTESARWWKLKLVAATVLASAFTAFPSYEALPRLLEQRRWVGVKQQLESVPGYWANVRPEERSSVPFRISVPLLVGPLGLGPAGCLVVQFLAGVILLVLLVDLAHRETQDGVVAALFGIAVGFTYVGQCGLLELRGAFDAVALMFLAWAMHARSFVVVFVAMQLAHWTDERTLLVAPFIVLWWGLADDASQAPLQARRLINRRGAAVLAAGLAYAALYALVKRQYGIVTSAERLVASQGILGELPNQVNNAPLGAWTGLEGLWLLVFMALGTLFLHHRGLAAAYLGLIAVGTAATVAVVDITRSVIYLFPAGVVALSVLRRYETPSRLRWLVLVACGVCVLWPAYYAGGKSSVWLHYPLPLQAIRWLFL